LPSASGGRYTELVERALRQRRLRLIPASTWLSNRYHSVRMTATHSVRRDRGTSSDGSAAEAHQAGRGLGLAVGLAPGDSW